MSSLTPKAGNSSGAARRHLVDLLFALLVLAFVAISCQASRQESVTNDEFRHLSTGVHYWQSGDYSFDVATPPLWKMVMALPAHIAGAKTVLFRDVPEMFKGSEPWLVATDFMGDNAAAYNQYLQSARLVNIIAAAGCLILVYCRCRRSFGPVAALFGTAFLALSPTFIAHSHYATTDIIATFAITAFIFLMIDFLQVSSPGRLLAAAVLFALALLCKYTAVLVLPLLFVVPLLVVLRQTTPGGSRHCQAVLVPLARSLLLVIVTVLLTINLWYRFQGTGTSLGEMHLESSFLSALAQTPVASLPVPLPLAFVLGFDKQKADSDYAEFPAYLNGQWSVDGFPGYYLTAFSVKETIPFILLVVAAIGALFYRRIANFSRQELLLLLYVPVVLFLVLSVMNKLNVGVRYLLPAYPFFCIFIARLYLISSRQTFLRLVLPLLFVLHVASVYTVSPHYTSYFNQFAGGAAHGHHYLIDSNTDWGQDLPQLNRFMRQQGIEKVQLAYFGHGLPEHYGINYEPLALPAKKGYVAISVSLLQGHPYLLTYTDPPQIAEADQFHSLRDLQPIGRAGFSMMIFKVE